MEKHNKRFTTGRLATLLPASWVLELFDRSGDFEDYLGRFNTAVYHSALYRPSWNVFWPQYSAPTPKGNALQFLYALCAERLLGSEFLADAFRQNNTVGVANLKFRVKDVNQHPGQVIAVFATYPHWQTTPIEFVQNSLNKS